MDTETSMRTCIQCGDPVTGRSDQKYCSPRCRVAAHRARPQSDLELAGAAWEDAKGFRSPEVLHFLSRLGESGREKIARELELSAEAIRSL